MEETMVVLSTTGTMEDARRLARTFVEERLVACVNMIPIESVYSWEGNVQAEPEVLLVMKTASLRLHRLEERLQELHPYAVPEFVAMPAAQVGDAYQAWLLDWIS